MKLLIFQKNFRIITGVKFALLILVCLALASSLGSFIEQEQPINFYQENYPLNKPIFGFLTWKLIFQLGLDHVYRTWWFFFLLIFLVLSLISCTITRQFPIFSNSKEYFFRKKQKSFFELPFCIKIKNIFYFQENLVSKIQNLNFFIYQKGKFLYGYKGLIGRISPILVHFSLIIILLGSSISAFNNFQAQEILAKGEIFHIQNPIQIGWFTSLPFVSGRINDFWVEYDQNRIHQFYSNFSLLDLTGNEIKNQTISVNNPFHYKNLDFYQSDWNLIGIRFQNQLENTIFESPVFPLENSKKSWITWILEKKNTYTLVFDQLKNTFLIYDNLGNFIKTGNLAERESLDFFILDILPSTGLQIKYDPSISIIYFGFGFLMLTACLSYFPYTQIWILNQKEISWIGGSTNRGKLKLEIEFENLIRSGERILLKNIFLVKN